MTVGGEGSDYDGFQNRFELPIHCGPGREITCKAGRENFANGMREFNEEERMRGLTTGEVLACGRLGA